MWLPGCSCNSFPHPSPAEAIIDIATLTGACMIALGDGMCALFAASDEMAASVAGAAKEAGALGWGVVGSLSRGCLWGRATHSAAPCRSRGLRLWARGSPSARRRLNTAVAAGQGGEGATA